MVLDLTEVALTVTERWYHDAVVDDPLVEGALIQAYLNNPVAPVKQRLTVTLLLSWTIVVVSGDGVLASRRGGGDGGRHSLSSDSLKLPAGPSACSSRRTWSWTGSRDLVIALFIRFIKRDL
ncbi:hypothetical protein RRG08_004409 [Elysia crispata]|uniref:Uncharacterized protein n=1 Tax=Elysia crispata TaxID=231223 RepID=A0AAE1B838_9GAST|nr:hypothetical protein RRG08_004409 [Elysia crispata]